MANETLLSEFPATPTEAWEAAIEKDLKGADYSKKLVWRTAEGIAARPYYRADDLSRVAHLAAGEFPYVREAKQAGGWRVRQSYCACEDPAAANAQALDGLMKGVEAVSFCVPKDLTEAALARLLKGIYLDVVEVSLTPCRGCGAELTKMLVGYARQQGADLGKVQLAVEVDPLRILTGSGSLCEGAFDKLKAAMDAAAAVRHLRTIGVSGAALHNAGATAAQELAFALAMGVEYLAQLTTRGVGVAEIAARARFTFAVGASYFLEIAKLRAARMLWAHILSAYQPQQGEAAARMNIHAVTSAWNQTAYDAYVNMLRGTTESMSAAIAGADSLEVLRFDKPFKAPSDFANRIARNTQILLKEESHFDHVADPAGGSYYIETLTQSVAQEAWKLFLAVEERGGYLAAFRAGFVQEQVKGAAQKRDSNLASRRETLLGTNQYPNFGEALGKEAAEHLHGNDGCGCSTGCGCSQSRCCKSNAPLLAEPLPPYRGAQAFEALRTTTEAAAKTPEAFMLTFGSLAMCRARAQFACNFFAVAGFRVTDNNRFATIGEGVEAALSAGAEVVVCCSSDEDYAEAAPQIYEALKGKAIVVVAGEPECKPDLQAKGLSHFISVKSNVLETLRGYQQELGM
ncbi:MAG: methylmalonyl-CoA mutase family protein [Prevotellaceae bacterium]|jgi:methylmalonyl-CoA mutase|nr:methylmalonyl-CoA mutase family protein [Prevotellaceae bacterium]